MILISSFSTSLISSKDKRSRSVYFWSITSKRSQSMGSLRKGLLLKNIFFKLGRAFTRCNSRQLTILFVDISSSLRKDSCSIPLREVSLLFLRFRVSISLDRKGEISSITVIPLFQRSIDFEFIFIYSLKNVEIGISFFLRIIFGQSQVDYIIVQKRMANNQKYYHNDYKKLMGLDQSRTASQKLLDKAIGGFKRQPIQQKQEKAPEKKIKQENKNLTHVQILSKIVKNLQVTSNASKLLKPLSLLRKCLQDPGFVNNSQINTPSDWNTLLLKLLETQEKAIGNFSQINLITQQFLEIFILLQKCLLKLVKEQNSQIKTQELTKKQEKELQEEKENSIVLRKNASICELQILYCKMFTDDSFTFNKTLIQFKKKYFQYFQNKLSQNDSLIGNESFYKFLQNLLMKLFKLQYTKHQWIKTSLSQFFKEFNISYRPLLSQQLCENYLKSYNAFLNHKLSRGAGQEVNVFGNGGKGGKITQIQTVSDGLDKWTSKQ